MTYVCGAAARMAAVHLKGRLLEAAADLLGIPQGNLRVAPGRIEVAGTAGSGLSNAEVVNGIRTRHGTTMTVTSTYHCLSNPGSYSAQFAEVEADMLTGSVRVIDFLAVADVGRAINPSMVEGQYRGAVQAGIGGALCEEVVLDAEGRTASGGFKNYHLINAVDMPEVKVLLVEHEGDDGPFGAKSVGEIAVVPTAAAVINALNRALGTSIVTLPATPEAVVAALLQRQAVGRSDPPLDEGAA